MRVLVAQANSSPDSNPLEASATNLNRNGGLLTTEGEWKISSCLLLTNRFEQTAAARVVSKVGGRCKIKHYGVEFVDGTAGATFWGITFLPDSAMERPTKT
ncbi:MAG: hypothetical protein AB7O65_03490 [Candidatus Korobacteraceae bacterium]